MRALLLALGLLFTCPAARADIWHATYDAYVGGANAVRLTAAFRIDHAGYKLEVQSRTLGVLDLFVGSRQSTLVEGVWAGMSPRPGQFRAEGIWKGERRTTLIDYHAGMPTIRNLLPAEQVREPVPLPARQNTLDRLSLLAQLSRQIAQTGRCDTTATTFDGRRLEENTSRTGGWDILPASNGAAFTGRALRCEIELRMTAGFTPDEDRAHAGRIRRAQVWVAAPNHGAPVVPVRFALDIGWLGSVTAFLSSFERGVR